MGIVTGVYSSVFVGNSVDSGHVGTRHFVLYREVVLSSEVKSTSIIGKWNFGTLKCVLYREFFFLLCPLFGVSFIGGSTVHLQEEVLRLSEELANKEEEVARLQEQLFTTDSTPSQHSMLPQDLLQAKVVTCIAHQP